MICIHNTTLFRSLPAGHVTERFDKEDSRGRYKLENPTGPGPRGGDSGEPWQGFNPTERNRAWAPPRKLCIRLGIDPALPTRKKLDALLAAGRIELPKTAGNIPMLKVYLQDLEETQGTAFQDVWAYQPYTQGYYYGHPTRSIDDDVKWMGPTSGERIGFQTQKPEGLIERIIRCSCPEGGIVLDPFCGCGTTIVVAERLGRPWIGIDITHVAIDVVQQRLRRDVGERAVYRIQSEPKALPDAVALARRDRMHFQTWALGLVGARGARGSGEVPRGADRGIDGRLYDEHGRVAIVSVKSGKPKVLDVRDLRAVVEREQALLGILITLYGPTRAMITEAATAGVYDTPQGLIPRLQVLTVAQLLDPRGRGVAYPPVAAQVQPSPEPVRRREPTQLPLMAQIPEDRGPRQASMEEVDRAVPWQLAAPPVRRLARARGRRATSSAARRRQRAS